MSGELAQFGAAVPEAEKTSLPRFLAWLTPLGERLGRIQNRLLMKVVYLFVIGPLALCLRLCGKDTLDSDRLGPESLHSRPEPRGSLQEHLRRGAWA